MTTAERIKPREAIHKAIDELPPESLEELGKYIEFLRYKQEHDMDWFERLYDLFAPVREATAEMSEEEVDQIIDEAIAEVRRERKA